MNKFLSASLLLITLIFTGCARNSAGNRGMISESQELALGEENFEPLVQYQGGRYIADPEVQNYVENVGYRLAKHSNRPDLPYEFAVINDSTPNAWSLPGGKIGINRGLLTELDNEAELAAVMGHEIAHATESHVVERMEKQYYMGAIMGVFSAVGGGEVVEAAAGIGTNMITAGFSRADEKEADALGMETMSRAGYDPQGAVELQEAFVRLSERGNGGWGGGLFATHPPSKKRVKANEETAKLLPKGGERGEREYERSLAQLTKTKQAYAYLDSGEEAMRNKRYSQAYDYGRQAYEIVRREPRVYSLMGRAQYHMSRSRDALASLDKAIQLNPNYFFDYYARAVVQYDLGQYDAARRDADRSLALLPTNEAKSIRTSAENKLRGR